MPCGGPTQKPEPRSKRYGPKWQRTAILGVFFFPAGPVPLYILQDGPASLGARKVLRPICGRSGIFPATTGPDKKKKKKNKNQRWWCVSQRQPATTNARTTSNQTSTLTSTSLWRIRPGARDPPPAPCMSAWAFACHMTWLTAPVLLNGGSVCLGVCHAGACAHTCVGIYHVPVACRWRRCVRLWARGPCVSRLCTWAICGARAFVRACVCVTRL